MNYHSIVMVSEILAFLDFLPFSLPELTASPTMCCIVVASGEETDSETELGPCSSKLTAATAWSCAVFLEQHKLAKHRTIADEQKGFYNQLCQSLVTHITFFLTYCTCTLLVGYWILSELVINVLKTILIRINNFLT